MALVHGDGQYAPEFLPDLVRPVRDGEADAVLGSRMLERREARRGGMPLYKLVGNRILTPLPEHAAQDEPQRVSLRLPRLLDTRLRGIPFDLNTNDFHFDTEIIIQLLYAAEADP